MLEIGEDMVAVLDAVDDGGEFATHPAVHPGAEDCGDLVVGEPPQTELAAAFEQFVDRKVPLEDEVAAVDASLTMAWYFDERARCRPTSCWTTAPVPALWRLKVANTFQTAIRRQRVESARVTR